LSKQALDHLEAQARPLDHQAMLTREMSHRVKNSGLSDFRLQRGVTVSTGALLVKTDLYDLQRVKRPSRLDKIGRTGRNKR
jgi:hypothetical protein